MDTRCAVALGALSMLAGCVGAPLLLAEGGVMGGEYALTKHVTKNFGNSMEKANLQQITAELIGGDIAAGAIKVTQVHDEGGRRWWSADTPVGHYLCSHAVGHTTSSCHRA